MNYDMFVTDRFPIQDGNQQIRKREPEAIATFTFRSDESPTAVCHGSLLPQENCRPKPHHPDCQWIAPWGPFSLLVEAETVIKAGRNFAELQPLAERRSSRKAHELVGTVLPTGEVVPMFSTGAHGAATPPHHR